VCEDVCCCLVDPAQKIFTVTGNDSFERSSISRDVKGPLCIIIEYMTDNCVAEVDNAAAMI
jgi:hypothetical protein